MRSKRILLLTSALVVAAGCATSAPPATRIARLERARNASPTSPATLRALGILYYKSGRIDDARRVLAEAARLDPRDATTTLYLGLAAERQNDLAAARVAYTTYLSVGRTSRVRGQLESRLAALTRKELEASAKQAVAQELQLAGTPGSPRTIAVMPLSFTGSDSTLRPLQRGMADLLVTDLARSAQLTVVERARLQALLGEMELQRAGATEAATNVRAGRLLQAGRLVQGSIAQQGNQIRVDAAVVDVPTTQVAGTANSDAALDQLFTLEKTLVLNLFRTLGVTLTAAEREAIEQRPTRSLQAFLAYSRGLGSEDAGRFDEAQRHYGEAVRLDPAFVKAGDRLQQARALQASTETSVQTVESSLRGTTEGAVTDAAMRGYTDPAETGLGATVRTVADDINPSPNAPAAMGGSTSSQRDPAADGTGTDNPTRRGGRVVIVIQRPGA
jgi:TolB-like protein